MGRKSAQGLPPGIQLDQHGAFWATLEGDDAKTWRKRYPGRSRPRKKAASLKEARALQRALIEDLRVGRDPQAHNPKIADLVETWISGRQKLAAGTLERYRTSLKWQIEPHRLGRVRLAELTTELVREWVRDLKGQSHQRKPDQKLDPHSIRNAFALLRAALNSAIVDGLIVRNPCKGVELPRPEDEEIEPLDPAQIDTLLQLLDTYERDRKSGDRYPHRQAALYHVAIFCGLRQGELFGLRWRDIDFKRREVRVTSQMRRGARTRTKTPKGRRTVPITSRALAALEWHRQNQAEERAIGQKDGQEWNAGDLVFCSENGTPLDSSNIGAQLDRFLKAAKLPDLHFHGLRHTYAALSIAAGVDIYTLSRRMGHSSISLTADKYGHLYQPSGADVDALDLVITKVRTNEHA
jgi:integrase